MKITKEQLNGWYSYMYSYVKISEVIVNWQGTVYVVYNTWNDDKEELTSDREEAKIFFSNYEPIDDAEILEKINGGLS